MIEVFCHLARLGLLEEFCLVVGSGNSVGIAHRQNLSEWYSAEEMLPIVSQLEESSAEELLSQLKANR